MAIGAGRGDVMRMIVTGGMRVALIGVLVGIAGALALSRLLRTMLFGVTVVDPASYAATALMLLAVAAFACYIPARRAMRLDPLSALREQWRRNPGPSHPNPSPKEWGLDLIRGRGCSPLPPRG